MIQWNPYPKTKPPRKGDYLVSVFNGAKNFTFIDNFDTNEKFLWKRSNNDFVTAWAEIPQPFEKPIKLKAYPIDSVPENVNVIFISECGNYEFSRYASGQTHPKCIGWTHWSHMPEFDFVEE